MSSISLITGGPGSGKCTTGKQVAQCFPKCLLISVDDLRDMMVKGGATPAGGLTEELISQFQMVRASAIHMARVYAGRGVDVIIDDVCYPSMFADHYASLLDETTVRAILLLPKLEVLIQRIKARTGPWDHILVDKVAELYEFLEPMDKSRWIVLDTSDWTVERTVEAIRSRLGCGMAGSE